MDSSAGTTSSFCLLRVRSPRPVWQACIPALCRRGRRSGIVAGLLELDQKIRKLEQSKQDKPIDPADYIDKKELERGKMQNKLHGVLAGAGDNYHEKAEKI